MLKLLIIQLCILFIHSTKQVYCNEQKQNYFINNFLNKLITSKKFDELADIIAEKAARKIQALDKINGSQPQLGETKNNVNRSFKKNYSDDDDISNETDEKGESKPRSVTNNKLFNINPKVFKQLGTQEELSLNYRYLLKKSPYNRDGNGRNTVKLSEDNNKYDVHKKNVDSENEDKTHRSNSNKETIKNNDSEYMQKEQIANKKIQSDESSKIKHPKSSEDEESIKVTRSFRTENYNGRDEEQSTNEKFDTKDSKDSEEARPITQQQLKKQSTKKEHLQTVRQSNEVKENEVSYEDSDEKPKPSKGNNEITTLDSKANLKKKKNKYNPPHITEDQVTIEKFIPHLTTNQIREEAGKQLIYEPAPEYHEYFEKLAKSKPPSIETFLT